MKHISSQRFDELVSYLQNNVGGFTLADLAVHMKCSTERIRLLRLGKGVLTLPDIYNLIESYQVNELFLTRGKKPYLNIGPHQLLAEPDIQYNTSKAENEKLREEIILLKNAIQDKEHIIELLREKTNRV